jgi:hypothetical protein
MARLRDNGLTIVLLLLFAASIVGQWVAGWHVALEDAARHHQPGLSIWAYSGSPQFLSSVFENWESEFLQMSAYVVLTAMLVQRGSSESRDPDAPPRDADLAAQALKPGAPAVLRKGRLARALYARSLGLMLAMLFLASFILHWTQSARRRRGSARAWRGRSFHLRLSRRPRSVVRILPELAERIFIHRRAGVVVDLPSPERVARIEARRGAARGDGLVTAHGKEARGGLTCLVARTPGLKFARCANLMPERRNKCARRASKVRRPVAGAFPSHRAGFADARYMTPGPCPGGR